MHARLASTGFLLLAMLLGAAACGPEAVGGDGDGGGGGADASDTPDGPRGDSGQIGGGADGGPDGSAPLACSDLGVTVRDFRRTHPDFETFTRDEVFPGIVEAALDSDKKPVYAHPGPTLHTTGPTEFAQWYHDTPDVNVNLPVVITLAETSPGLYVYDDADFFPIDNLGFGNDGFAHNFHFTTEIHTTFEYRGGEVFTFRGDDDVWVFLNRQLAIDLGGLHQPATGTINLDAIASSFGIAVGDLVPMDIFQAERHTVLSNFRIETTIDCFVIP